MKPIFIVVTPNNGKHQIAFNVSKILWLDPDTTKGTLIIFDIGEDGFLSVKETMNEISNQIADQV